MILSCGLVARNIVFRSSFSGSCARCFSILHAKLRGGRCQPRRQSGQTRAASRANKVAYIFNPGDTPLLNITIGQLLDEAVAQWPERTCVISHQNVSLTFAELARRVDALAAGLKKLGLKKGDRLAIWGPNDVEWIITSLSTARLGLISVNINPAYQQKELEYCLKKVDVKAVVSPASYKTQNYPEMLFAVKQACPNLKHIIVYSQDHVTGTHRFVDIEALATKAEVAAIAAEQSEISCDEECNIQFTSGSTGEPKSTVLSHKSFVNTSRQVCRISKITTEDRICLNVPMFHIFGILIAPFIMLNTGCTIVLEAPSFNPVKSIETVAREKCSFMNGTPTMWVNLIQMRNKLQLPINSLRSGFIGGAPVAPELFRQIRSVFDLDVMILYGLTEITGPIFQSLPDVDPHMQDKTVGHVINDVEVMVVDEKDSPVPYGTPGELWVRGYCNMKHYWNDEVATRKTITPDGWLKTGDQFVLYENGFGSVIGRLKEMIIRGGENIFPKEIEDYLMLHPKIQEVQVIGAYDEIYGEEICACVLLRNGEEMTESELKDFCKGKIAHFKIPRYVAFVKDFPKLQSGKIQKFRLKKQMEETGVIPVKKTANSN